MWFIGGSPAIFIKDGQEIYRTPHIVKGLYYDDKFTNESRNVEIVKDRLYFVTEVQNSLVEYDLPLLDEFIKEKLEYHPRKLAETGVSDYFVEDPKNIWVISPTGDLSKLKSFHGKPFIIRIHYHRGRISRFAIHLLIRWSQVACHCSA